MLLTHNESPEIAGRPVVSLKIFHAFVQARPNLLSPVEQIYLCDTDETSQFRRLEYTHCRSAETINGRDVDPLPLSWTSRVEYSRV